MEMKAIYIDFSKPLADDDELSNGLQGIITKYENKVTFITEESNEEDIDKVNHKHSQIRIFYNDGSQSDWLEEHANKEILVVNNWEDIEQIIDFYLKYDYKTLEEIR